MSGIRSASCASKSAMLALVTLAAAPQTAEAHVKWFSNYSYAGRPNSIDEIFTPTFFWLALLSMVVIGAFVLVEESISHVPWVRKIDAWLRSGQHRAEGVLRLGLGAALLWDWQAGNLLAPELSFSNELVLWMEFVCAFLLIFKRTLPLAGGMLFVLYGIAVSRFGFFHMLDYLMYLGIGGYFIANASPRPEVKRAALPLMYVSLGFCLIWLGIEKLVYPGWAGMLLERHPMLALGFGHKFFVQSAAFVEMSLGFMIMACVQQRLLSVTITIFFFLTTLIFGRQEVVGHTLIHAVLIVFLIAGSGEAKPPLEWLKGVRLRVSGAAAGFAVFVGLMLMPYLYGANMLFQTSQMDAGNLQEAYQHSHDRLQEVSGGDRPPALAISLTRDPLSGWNLELMVENFQFSPEQASQGHVPGRGHAHLYIDDRKIARLYGRWYHIAELTPGPHEIRVTLNANNHSTLAVDGRPVAAVTQIDVVGG